MGSFCHRVGRQIGPEVLSCFAGSIAEMMLRRSTDNSSQPLRNTNGAGCRDSGVARRTRAAAGKGEKLDRELRTAARRERATVGEVRTVALAAVAAMEATTRAIAASGRATSPSKSPL